MKQAFWKTKTFFKKLEHRFLVESTKIENATFPYKTALSEAMLRQTELGVQNGSTAKNEYFQKKEITVLNVLDKIPFCSSLICLISTSFSIYFKRLLMLCNIFAFIFSEFTIFMKGQIKNKTQSHISHFHFDLLTPSRFFQFFVVIIHLVYALFLFLPFFKKEVLDPKNDAKFEIFHFLFF